jgi:hypothetical protein
MPFFAVLSIVLLFIAALGQSFWWRTTPQWYGGAAEAWGLFCLAVYLTWPTIRALF